MREELKRIVGVRARFRGTFERYGSAIVRFSIRGRMRSHPVKTLILLDVTDARGNLLTDHLWFRCGKQFNELQLQRGDRVEFTATVERYVKRTRDEYDGGFYLEGDYCLKRPARMFKLGVHDEKGRGLLFADLEKEEASHA
jgi:hypothetical protein